MTKRAHYREFLSEAIGTLVLVFFANGVVAAGLFYHAWNSFFELALITGLGVTIGIYVAAPNAAAHLNPAMTLAMAVWRKFPVAKVMPYIVAQVLGAFGGSSLAYFLYQASLRADSKTLSPSVPPIFYTSAAPGLTFVQAVFVELILTAALTIVIFAVTDAKNKTLPQGPWGAMVIGVMVFLLGSTFGSLTGFAMNPVRDLGPRIFAYLLGGGSMALPGADNYMWVPIVGPMLGAGLGGFIYEKILAPGSIRDEAEDTVINALHHKAEYQEDAVSQ